ncbi:MAG: Uma2 family endonuclease [Rhodospirillales bacterium]|nr:Uma2 family endonuclease [Rhodospirillales bacterium]
MRHDTWVARGGKAGRFLTIEDLERDFPGTEARRMTLAEFEAYERHIEYWDGDSELVAEVREPTTGAHNTPVESLAALTALISAVRGAPIRTFGNVSLVIRDASNVMRRALEADQTVYLHPGSAHMPVTGLLTVGEHDYPDVVLEVDHTTDARRRKLGLYEEWGFPEVWIDMPDVRSPGRPRGRLPGLSIRVLRDGAFRRVSASPAFHGWRADSIHRALNEPERSPETVADLTRIAAALGEREGTGPDDDLLMGAQRRQAYDAGEREGLTQVIGTMLAERGIETPPAFGTEIAQYAGLDRTTVVRAALACRDIDDFRERLRYAAETS